MFSRVKTAFVFLVVSLLLLGLPLAGVWLVGKPLAPYLAFPPLTRQISPAPFSGVVFAALAALSLATVAGLARVVMRAAYGVVARPPARGVSFPGWGWAGVIALAIAWTLAWARFPWFKGLQAYTFTPLWLAYIVVVNALSHRRTGHCLMLDRPGYFAALFPLSALFWWYFEYLNRYVQNWYYAGIQQFGPEQYALFATLAFSTVLPAVLSTREWLASFAWLGQGAAGIWPVSMRHARRVAVAVLIGAGTALAGVGVWPNVLFPVLWVSPLLIIVALQALMGEATLFAPLRSGDWRPVYLPALAGLMCGFFWELWNYKSLAQWRYAVPWVQRYEIFEMPALGYLGYIPFGVECAVIGGLLERLLAGRAHMPCGR